MRIIATARMVMIGTVLCLLLLANTAMGGDGSIKVAVNDQTIETGEEFGMTIILDGTGQYDVYAVLAMGDLSDLTLYWLDDKGAYYPLETFPFPVIKSNIDLGTAALTDKLIEVYPKGAFPPEGLGGASTYYVLGALCSPGQFDFPALDFVQIDVTE